MFAYKLVSNGVTCTKPFKTPAIHVVKNCLKSCPCLSKIFNSEAQIPRLRAISTLQGANDPPTQLTSGHWGMVGMVSRSEMIWVDCEAFEHVPHLAHCGDVCRCVQPWGPSNIELLFVEKRHCSDSGPPSTDHPATEFIQTVTACVHSNAFTLLQNTSQHPSHFEQFAQIQIGNYISSVM